MNKSQNMILATHIIKAQSFYAKLKGLMGQKTMSPGEVLWIPQCKSIHTCFMHFHIDVLFADKSFKVAAIYRNLKPWCFTRWHWQAGHVFEWPSHKKPLKAQVGDQLYVEA